ncbi:hypothetical protein BABINDRAFT_164467 [Babjeviella inositovora NRRL Y-12698]|uniref:Ribosome quality control complex subunit 2 n=1 Tax=Babjeviella inositovora NRRL Y-12698 TaxID=984486 RepID=A0A1E3QYH2_9ASCO|nr:uncharacterized protein BABINDRAFT_164467 [Babjeviella inositovora NRRL Y-12698]ODQ82720.1 hypothetical protein BABINDRAFT_164467 [Babjeviella inositovora NRRL Y-12698]
MKQRISALDLQIITSELRSIVDYRLQNIYNVVNSNRHYVFKFSIPDLKKNLVVDCGAKLHLTDFARSTELTPSNFVTKLRKHLKTRRLSGLRQVGNDRILVLEFSDGLFYLVFEFFSAGNIILLDHTRKILSLQRLVDEKENNGRYAVNSYYTMFGDDLFETEYTYEKKVYTAEAVQAWIARVPEQLQAEQLQAEQSHFHKKKKQSTTMTIQKLAFVNAAHLSSDLIKTNLHAQGVNPSLNCTEAELEPVVRALNDAEAEYVHLSGETVKELTGFIVAVENPLFNPEAESSVNTNVDLEYLYEEFHPFRPSVKDAKKKVQIIEVTGYNKTLDKFFSTIESSKYSLKIQQQEQLAAKRLQQARSQKDNQVQALVSVQENNIRKGEAITYHAEQVEAAMGAVQALLDQQMDWKHIEKLIKVEQQRGNAVAKTVKSLNLLKNKIELRLPDMDELEFESDSSSESDSDGESKPKKAQQKQITVTVDLGLSAFANARTYFDAKRTAEVKKSKVEKSATLALRSAERKIQMDLRKNLKQETDVLKAIRTKYWFEKFYWFVSSEGYLVVAGRDAMQTDTLLSPENFNPETDVFVTCDLDNSLKVVVKNPYTNYTLAPSTLMQAGMLAISTSKAWENKICTSAWWAKGTDVSKYDFDGTLLKPGMVNVTAEKRYLQPCLLVMGFGFLWLGDAEATQKYRELRLQRMQDVGLELVQMKKEKKERKKFVREEKKEEEKKKEEKKEVESEVKTDDESITESIASMDIKSLPLKMPKVVRGKKAKLKKIATKYADQDDEERRMRMQVLGVLKQVEPEKQEDVPKGNPNHKIDNEAMVKVQETRARREREWAARTSAKQEGADANEALLSDNELSDDEPPTHYLEIFDSLIAKPQSQDVLIDAVPVFAPWPALQKLKYKVKIQPGALKKGKTVAEVANFFMQRAVVASPEDRGKDLDVDWPEEHELIKSMKDVDLILPISCAGKMKIVASGGNTGGNGNIAGSYGTKEAKNKKSKKK